ncbi:hypothetical protein LJC33_05105 [Eubacteriales bacterium OttesenSCG-928-N13]|nr:hypothetical protein [Eubacteriales bacterium OttesenSCG-928-N13]
MPLSMAADFDVYVDAQPHRYESSPQLIALTSPGVITNPGSVPSEPVLTVMGSGDIALLVAGQTVLIAGLQYEIIIDCEAKLAYKNNLDGTMTLLTNSVTLPDDEWPTMPSGPVPVSWAGNVTEVEIRGNWRWL